MLLRLIPSSQAWRHNGRACERSIIAVRPATVPLSRAPRTKIVHQRPFVNLCVERLYVNCRFNHLAPRLTAEYTGSHFQELTTPLCNLIGVNVKLLRQLGQRLLALNGGQGHLRLECRAVGSGGVACSFLLLSHDHHRRRQAENPLIELYSFAKPPLVR